MLGWSRRLLPYIRRRLYFLCLAIGAGLVVLPYLLWVLIPPPVQRSVHPAISAPPPLFGLREDSVFNAGDAQALDAFPEVGEVIAQRIIDTREALGGFIFPEDLMLVKGIGEKTYAEIMAVFDEELAEVDLEKLADKACWTQDSPGEQLFPASTP